jgi:hypothetical protein
VLSRLSNSDVYQESLEELDEALSEMTSNASFPQVVDSISFFNIYIFFYIYLDFRTNQITCDNVIALLYKKTGSGTSDVCYSYQGMGICIRTFYPNFTFKGFTSQSFSDRSH